MVLNIRRNNMKRLLNVRREVIEKVLLTSVIIIGICMAVVHEYCDYTALCELSIVLMLFAGPAVTMNIEDVIAISKTN